MVRSGSHAASCVSTCMTASCAAFDATLAIVDWMEVCRLSAAPDSEGAARSCCCMAARAARGEAMSAPAAAVCVCAVVGGGAVGIGAVKEPRRLLLGSGGASGSAAGAVGDGTEMPGWWDPTVATGTASVSAPPACAYAACLRLRGAEGRGAPPPAASFRGRLAEAVAAAPPAFPPAWPPLLPRAPAPPALAACHAGALPPALLTAWSAAPPPAPPDAPALPPLAFARAAAACAVLCRFFLCTPVWHVTGPFEHQHAFEQRGHSAGSMVQPVSL